MSAVLEAKAVITAVDQTKGAFDSFEARVKAASSQTKALGAAMSSIGRISGPMGQVTGSISRAEQAIGAFGQSSRAVDEVSAAVARAAKTMPQLAGQAAALSKISAETARAGQQLAAELNKVDAAAGRMNVFRSLQTGFAEARRSFYGAKEQVEGFARAISESDAKLVAMRQRHAILGAAQDRAAAAALAARPTRDTAKDPEAFRTAQAAAVVANAEYNRHVDERRALGAEIEAEAAANAKLRRGYGGAQAEVGRVAAGLEQQKAALIGVKREMEALVGGPVKSLAGAEAALKAKVDSVNRAMLEQARAAHGSAEAGAAALRAAEAKAHRGRAGHGGSQLAEIASLYGTIEASEVAHRVIERYRDFDKERRYGRVVMGLDDAGQAPLVAQAIHGSADSKFNDIQWLETQRELAARGYGKDQVLGFTPTVAQLGQSFDVSMPEAVKGLEGAMLAFRKDTSTLEKAQAAATRTADLQVKASKISGMSFEDIVQLYKYGAAPAQMAHLSEESLLAFGAISKKSNMGGDESGVAFRALAKNLISPTASAQVAMRAAGIDFNAYQHVPDHLDTAGFVDTVAKKFGVALDSKAQAGIEKIFRDKALIGDAARFMPAIRAVLGDALGGDDAKSKTKIAGLAGAYRDASMQGVDTNGLMAATITAMAKNPALANAIFGSKQGGRIYAALGEPDVLNHILDELKNQSQGFARKVSDERMAGFDGSLSKLGNALANVETALGRAWDGQGSGGLLTDATAAAARLTQSFAEASPVVQRTATEVAALGAAAAAMKGFGLFKDGFGMGSAAVKLDGSAFNLDAAARALQLAAGQSEIAGAVPGGGKGGLGRAAVREGQAVAKGALAAEAVEIAATGVTLSATTIMLGALGAAVILDAIKSSMTPKPRAVDRPGYGQAFAPTGLDPNKPGLSAEQAEAAKPWFNRGRGHPRGGNTPAPREPGHWALGRAGTAPHWVEDAPGPSYDALFYHLDPETGLPMARPDYGRATGQGAHIGPAVPLVHPTALPPVYPEGRTKDDLSLGGGRPVPVAIVSAPGSPAVPAPDHWLDGGRQAIEERARRSADDFRRDPEAARGRALMEHAGSAENLKAVVEGPITAQVTGSADVKVVVEVRPTSQLLSAVANAGSATMPLTSGGSTGGTGVQRTAAAPGTGSSGGIGHR